MMIAIVILGLGLVMVATMFPVAWDRARTLSEHTIEQSAASAAQATIEAVVRPAGATLVRIMPAPTAPPFDEARLNSGSFAGDMFFDPVLTRRLLGGAPDQAFYGVVLYSDTRVHALHMENVLAEDGTVVAEEPWRIEQVFDIRDGDHPAGAAFGVNLGPDFGKPPPNSDRGRSFYAPQVRVAQRMHAPLDGRPLDTAPDDLDRWQDRLSSRRFCWAVLHRLRGTVDPVSGHIVPPIGPPCEHQGGGGGTTLESPQCFWLPSGVPGVPVVGKLCGWPRDPGSPPPPRLNDRESTCLAAMAAQEVGSTRNFDVYYVTLRRPQSTHRYARQDPSAVPNPYEADRDADPVAVAALGDGDEDVLLPVAWRVQVQLLPPPPPPATLALRANATHVPTEVAVPASPGIAGQTAAMIVSMFPQGTQFIDEMTGLVFRVAKRRITKVSADGQAEQAVLTLDRGIVQEDVDILANDARIKCDACTGTATAPSQPSDPEDLRRTVWVFPPPVDRSVPDKPIFDGPSPVVGIEVRTLSVSPGA